MEKKRKPSSFKKEGSQKKEIHRKPSSNKEEAGRKKETHRKPSPYKKDSGSKKEVHGDAKPYTGLTRLNKFIANAGICSRREADQLIQAGVIKINGKVVTELGTKVSPTDKVQYNEQTLQSEKLVYVLLNKPKGFITTVDDPFERKTVMSLVQNAAKERIYPVGRLDRNTTGLLLFTNDGEMTKKLTHPSHRIEKIYHVFLDKSLSKNDIEKVAQGFELDDGFIKVDDISYIEGESKKEIGVKLHSGRNRIVRRIFESLDYKVMRLDRVVFAGLTKKDVPRGKWRLLTDDEVKFLKMKRG